MEYNLDDQDIPNNKVVGQGVGLRRQEWDFLQEYADRKKLTLHAVALWLLRDNVKKLWNGEIEIPVKKKTITEIDDNA